MDTELRPLSLGEILDRTFQLYRTHFQLFAGIGAVAGVVRLAANALNLAVTRGSASGGKTGPAILAASVVGSLLAAAIILIAYTLVVAAVTRAVTAVYLGETIMIREAYRTVMPRTLRYLGLSLTAFLLAWWPVVLIAILFGVAAVATRGPATGGPNVLLALFGFGVFLAVPFSFWLFLRYTLGSAVCVYEGLNIRESLRRSVTLSEGTRGRIFLLLFVTAILQGILSAALAAPLIGAASRGHVSTGVTLYGLLVDFISTCLATPIYSIGLTLFYLDARVRKEGFDIEWLLGKSEPPRMGTDGMRTDPSLG